MKLSYLLYIIAALITIYGLVTGQFFFLLFVFPLGLFSWNKKDKNQED
ncbi:hypothetical protein [Haloflavibacter putidus]|nr:hypothetical protein [Haloflavibacter putidus]